MQTNAALPAFDREDLLLRLGQDTALAAQILEMTIEELEEQGPAIELALAGGDLAVGRELAHSLKGVTANTSAIGLSDLAAQIENACRGSDLVLARELASCLSPETVRFKKAIAA
ncbi:MAG: Hpt domain-containing protein [Kiritimatiellia bacterium]|jgi:HPt (histidine-containing phosphotransfer) domain-containing protein|nr:Hpt domain-containing protein [Kiritimatiellia bacterium]